MTKEIKTPWGVVIPQVSLFPIFYLMFIYGLIKKILCLSHLLAQIV